MMPSLTVKPPTYIGAAASAAAAASGGTRLRENSSVRSPTGPTPETAKPRRVWVRRRGTTEAREATSVLIGADELVDDFKTRVLAKYSTTLLQTCDAADLAVSMRLPSSTKKKPPFPLIELSPDEELVAVIDKYYPNGLTIQDALEIGPRKSLPSEPEQRSVSDTGPNRPQLQIQSHELRASALPSPKGSHPPNRQMPPVPEPPVAMRPPLSRQTSTQSRKRASTVSHAQLSAFSSGPSSPSGQHPSSNTSPLQGAGFQRTPSSHLLLLPRMVNRPSRRESAYGEEGHPAEMSLEQDRTVEHIDADLDDDVKKSKPETQVRGRRRQHDSHHQQTPSQQLQEQIWAAGNTHISGRILNRQVAVVPQINVLIVEDNVINQKILEAFMRRKRVRYSVARNGREALEKWRQGGFHLILMDIQLPVMTGLEATKEIRRLEVANGIGVFPYKRDPGDLKPPAKEDQLPKTAEGFRSPVIIVALTASDDDADKSEALAVGCNDFLTKPVNHRWLELKITEWGCMQALIDFDGWKHWLYEPPLTGQSEEDSKSKSVSEPDSESNSSETPISPGTVKQNPFKT